MTEITTTCGICKRPLATGDILAEDCGGDCYACIMKIENDLPWDIEDTRLRELEPELTALSNERVAFFLASMPAATKKARR